MSAFVGIDGDSQFPRWLVYICLVYEANWTSRIAVGLYWSA